MTTKEKITVMQAFLDGKPIEYKLSSDDNTWLPVSDPHWDWDNCIYRIKSELKLRPYNSAEEFLQAQQQHGPYLKSSGQYYNPIMIDRDKGIVYADKFEFYFKDYEELMKLMVWQDGSPCCISEE